MNEATEATLAAYRTDLQRQLQGVAVVERLSVREAVGMLTIVAIIRIGARTFQLTGTGDNYVAAYAELLRSVPEPVLRGTYSDLLDSRLRS